jgi:hypothetical protein
MIFLLCPFVLVIEIDLYLAIVDATKVYKHNYLRIFLRILLAFLLSLMIITLLQQMMKFLQLMSFYVVIKVLGFVY